MFIGHPHHSLSGYRLTKELQAAEVCASDGLMANSQCQTDKFLNHRGTPVTDYLGYWRLGRPDLKVGSTVPWAGALNLIKRRQQQAEDKHSSLGGL